MKRILLAILVGTSLLASGCGVTYNSATVRDQANGTNVNVVTLTPMIANQANSAAFKPRALPAAFYAVSSGSANGAGSTGSLPALPYIPNEVQRERVLRLPPALRKEPYRIGVGDVVLLATKQAGTTVAELTGLLAAQNQRQGYTVRDDGSIAVPDLGTIRIAGLTINEAENRLFDELVRNQIDPAFSLEVSDFRSQRVVVGGSVANTGVIPIGLNTLTLDTAISQSGGVTLSTERFGIIRLYRDGRLYEIPLSDYRSRQDIQNLPLTNGDAVFVDTTYDLDNALKFYKAQLDVISQRRIARSAALEELQAEFEVRNGAMADARSNFLARLELGAEGRDYAYVTGEFSTQTRVPLPFNKTASLADIIYEVGGVKPITGNSGQVYVLRATEKNDAVTAFHLDMANVGNIPLATKFVVKPNDVIFAEEQPITKWSRALEQFFPTLIGAATSASN